MVNESFYRDGKGNVYRFSDGKNRLEVNGSEVLLTFVGRTENRSFFTSYVPRVGDGVHVDSGPLERLSEDEESGLLGDSKAS